MKQFLTVFKFEFKNFLKNKIFIGLTLVVALIITLVTFFPRFTDGKDISINLGDETAKTLLLINKSDEALT